MGAFDLHLPVVPTRLRINAAQYYRMAEVGIIAPDARVELTAVTSPGSWPSRRCRR
jgi:hypothetical protein